MATIDLSVVPVRKANELIRKFGDYHVSDGTIKTVRQIITVAMCVNVFLIGCEAFTEFYAGTYHVAAAKYLYFGLHGKNALVPWIWTAAALI